MFTSLGESDAFLSSAWVETTQVPVDQRNIVFFLQKKGVGSWRKWQTALRQSNIVQSVYQFFQTGYINGGCEVMKVP